MVLLGGQILTPRSPLSQGEGASWKGDGGVLLLGYYSVDGVLVMFYY